MLHESANLHCWGVMSFNCVLGKMIKSHGEGASVQANNNIQRIYLQLRSVGRSVGWKHILCTSRFAFVCDMRRAAMMRERERDKV
jgi:hypothetical protein